MHARVRGEGSNAYTDLFDVFYGRLPTVRGDRELQPYNPRTAGGGGARPRCAFDVWRKQLSNEGTWLLYLASHWRGGEGR